TPLAIEMTSITTSKIDAKIQLNDTAQAALRGDATELSVGRIEIRSGEVRVVGCVQQIDGEVRIQAFVNPEAAHDLRVPIANAVGAEGIESKRKRADVEGTGLVRRTAFEADEA